MHIVEVRFSHRCSIFSRTLAASPAFASFAALSFATPAAISRSVCSVTAPKDLTHRSSSGLLRGLTNPPFSYSRPDFSHHMRHRLRSTISEASCDPLLLRSNVLRWNVCWRGSKDRSARNCAKPNCHMFRMFRMLQQMVQRLISSVGT